MIQFQKQPIGKLNLDGTTEGLSKPQKPVDVGMPVEELQKQVINLTAQGVPVEKILQAIEAHPDITDKDNAKKIASAIYEILGKSGSLKQR